MVLPTKQGSVEVSGCTALARRSARARVSELEELRLQALAKKLDDRHC